MTGNEAASLNLADWCQPILVDYLRELYTEILGSDHKSLRILSLSHGRMWRILILGDAEKLAVARKEIIGIARLAGLNTSAVELIDQAVLAELMDVIVSRFLRSPDLTRAYGRIVVAAAMRLARLGLQAA